MNQRREIFPNKIRLNPREIIRVKFVHCSFHHILTSSGIVSKKNSIFHDCTLYMRANTNFLPKESNLKITDNQSKRRLFLTLVFITESPVCGAENKEIMSVRKNHPDKERVTKQLSRERRKNRSN